MLPQLGPIRTRGFATRPRSREPLVRPGRSGATCDGAWAEAWPPLTVAGPDLPAGLDSDLFNVVERTDSSFQLVAGEWPLYRFAGDAAPGDTNGQGSGGVWFAVAPDGSLIDGPNADPVAAGSAY
jgi:Secreted repeat of unknown function